MRRALLPVMLLVFGLIVAGCGTPPPLVSDKYLNDTSLLGSDPNCTAPCFQGITIGQTTFADALSKVKANTLFDNVQSQDNPPQAAWNAKGGEACCQMTADATSGVVDAVLLRVAPVMKIKDVISKLGEPAYVSVLPQDYSETETALGLVYPKTGNIVWVMPGNGASNVDENDPVVIVLYLDPAKFQEVLDTATLQGWNGYRAYADYRTATPVLTPRVTLTPSQ